MKNEKIFFTLTIFSLLFSCIVPLAFAKEATKITGKEIVSKCNYKYQGDDRKSKLTIVLRAEK